MPRTGLDHRLMPVILVCGLVLSGWAIRSVMTHSPAFSAENRVTGVFGQWHTRDNPALYDRPAYLFQQGYGFLNADVIATSAGETSAQIADVETGLTRSRRAVELLTESIALDPANAHAWAALAWARSSASTLADARKAMIASWELAPHNLQLAVDRLEFALMLTGPLRDLMQSPFSASERAGIARDLEVLQTHRPIDFTSFQEAFAANGV